MTPYLLDTNACIALINLRPKEVRDNFRRVYNDRVRIYVPTIVAFELWYGVAKSQRKKMNTQRVEHFLSGPVELCPFEEEDTKVAGEIRASLEKIGRPIGAYDVLIAAQSMRLKAILVTANHKEFSRVPKLRVEDWSSA